MKVITLKLELSSTSEDIRGLLNRGAVFHPHLVVESVVFNSNPTLPAPQHFYLCMIRG